jgi:hypothetical protein
MRQAFNDAEITGWEGLDGTYGLPDPNDSTPKTTRSQIFSGPPWAPDTYERPQGPTCWML